MPASDMLDVIHFFFESDLNVVSTEQLEARDRSRRMIYEDFYGYEYAFAATSPSKFSTGSLDGEMSLNEQIEDDQPVVPIDPIKRASKPYFPPTQGNAKSSQPFGALLDGPLTH